MAAIEDDLGVRSSWYFRWRTAHPAVVSALRRRGFEVGLHYETLTRNGDGAGMVRHPVDEALLEESRHDLRAEISAFADLFGPLRSVVPHGDSRIPGVHNADLLRGRGLLRVRNRVRRQRGDARAPSGALADRSHAAEGGWKDGIDPGELFAAGVSPILSVTHPNNWASGPSLWLDRLLRAMLPRGARELKREPGAGRYVPDPISPRYDTNQTSLRSPTRCGAV